MTITLIKRYFHEYFHNNDIKKYISSADIGLVHTITKWKSHKLGFSNKFMYSVGEYNN